MVAWCNHGSDSGRPRDELVIRTLATSMPVTDGDMIFYSYQWAHSVSPSLLRPGTARLFVGVMLIFFIVVANVVLKRSSHLLFQFLGAVRLCLFDLEEYILFQPHSAVHYDLVMFGSQDESCSESVIANQHKTCSPNVVNVSQVVRLGVLFSSFCSYLSPEKNFPYFMTPFVKNSNLPLCLFRL